MSFNQYPTYLWSIVVLLVGVAGCGYGFDTSGNAASLTQSTVTVANDALVSDGLGSTTVTVQLVNGLGEPLDRSKGTVVILAPSSAAVSEVTDHGDGSYTATYRALGPTGTVTVSATLNGQPITNTAEVSVTVPDSGFYLDENGLTIRCDDAAVGDTGSIALDGETAETYTKRHYPQLETLVRVDGDFREVANSCISGLTALNNQVDGQGFEGLFQGTDFNEPINHWDTSDVLDMSYAFESAAAFDQPLYAWDTSKVTNMTAVFRLAESFNARVDTWNTSSVVSMDSLFDGAQRFNQDVGGWDTSSVTDMSDLFRNAYTFNQEIGGWDTRAVEEMDDMFNDAQRFNQDLSRWNTSSVTDMSDMFEDAFAFNSDLSEWNVSNVENFTRMFDEARTFSADLSGWNTSSAEYMRSMFEQATAFNSDLSQWDVSNVISFEEMFETAHSFNGNIESWNTLSANSMDRMFRGANAFDQDLSGWCVASVTSYSDFAEDARFSFRTDTSKHPPFSDSSETCN